MSLLPAPLSTVTEVPRSGGGPRHARALARWPRGALALGRLRRPLGASGACCSIHQVQYLAVLVGGAHPRRPRARTCGRHRRRRARSRAAPRRPRPSSSEKARRKPSERHAAPVGEAQGPQQEPQLRRPGLLRRRPARQQLQRSTCRQVVRFSSHTKDSRLERVALSAARGATAEAPSAIAGSSVRGGRW